MSEKARRHGGELVTRILVMALAGALAADDETCRTPQGTLCRTMVWESSGWANESWGFHAIGRWSGTVTLAYGRDGRTYERRAQRTFRNYVIDAGQWHRAKVYLAGAEHTVEIDHEERTYRFSGIHGWPVWDRDDPECAKKSQHFLLTDVRRGREAMIAGIRSIEYTGRRSDSETHTYWLAPSLGCSQMRAVISGRNRMGLPTMSSHTEVTSVRLGEPEPALFELPAEYRQTR